MCSKCFISNIFGSHSFIFGGVFNCEKNYKTFRFIVRYKYPGHEKGFLSREPPARRKGLTTSLTKRTSSTE